MARMTRNTEADPLLDLAEAEAPARAPRVAAEPAPGEPDTTDTAPFNPALDDIVVEPGPAVQVDPPAPIVVIGGAGNDYILGGDGNDILVGGAGDDIIRGAAGNDALLGQDGNDILDGGLGDDWLVGDGGLAGNDVLKGEAGNDSLEGRWGNDRLDGGTGDDYVLGGDGNDSLVGGDGNDYMSGDAGNDTITGGEGLDYLAGGAGNDILRGGSFSDVLYGGDGNDRLEGGDGRDTMTGGYGRDVFVAEISGTTWNNHHYLPDLITDFSTWGWLSDRIDLGPALARTLFAGTTVQEAIDQGYFYLSQHGNPGEAGFGTSVFLDYNGLAPNSHGMGALRVLDLVGVAASQLETTDFFI
jgi:Ca2+-binding RTX toxin-like protein